MNIHVCLSNEDFVRILNVPVHDRETNVEMFAVENGKNLFKTHFVNWSNILNRASKYMNLKIVLSIVYYNSFKIASKHPLGECPKQLKF